MYKVYMITNLCDGKIYIGQTKRDLVDRFISHKYNKKSLFFEKIKEFGADNFKIETLCSCEKRHTAYEKEREEIISRRSFVPEIGYNIMIGHNHSEETKKKIKNTSKERVLTPEQLMSIQLMGLSRKGTKASEETIKKLSESHMGQIAWNKGKKLSLQHKKNLSLAKKGKILTESHKLAIKEAHLKRRKEM